MINNQAPHEHPSALDQQLDQLCQRISLVSDNVRQLQAKLLPILEDQPIPDLTEGENCSINKYSAPIILQVQEYISVLDLVLERLRAIDYNLVI